MSETLETQKVKGHSPRANQSIAQGGPREVNHSSALAGLHKGFQKLGPQCREGQTERGWEEGRKEGRQAGEGGKERQEKRKERRRGGKDVQKEGCKGQEEEKMSPHQRRQISPTQSPPPRAAISQSRGGSRDPHRGSTSSSPHSPNHHLNEPEPCH